MAFRFEDVTDFNDVRVRHSEKDFCLRIQVFNFLWLEVGSRLLLEDCTFFVMTTTHSLQEGSSQFGSFIWCENIQIFFYGVLPFCQRYEFVFLFAFYHTVLLLYYIYVG